MRAFAGRIGLALLLCFAVVGAGVVAVNRTIDAAVDKIRASRSRRPRSGRTA